MQPRNVLCRGHITLSRVIPWVTLGSEGIYVLHYQSIHQDKHAKDRARCWEGACIWIKSLSCASFLLFYMPPHERDIMISQIQPLQLC